jgi:PAS domain S-box-containing protein
MALHMRDVTPRREAQQHLMLLEGSIARLNDIVIITEAAPFRAPGPRIVFVNEAFERRTGYTRDEVIGHSPRFLQGADTQRAQLDRIRAALEQWERVRVDLINYTKAGEPYWVDLDVSPVWDELAPPHALGGGGPRHHRAQDRRGEDPVPGLLRPADASCRTGSTCWTG